MFAALHYFCLQESVRKKIISLAEASLFFTGIDRKELGVIDLLTEIFKIRSDICWLQEHANTIENLKLEWKMAP